MFMYVIVGTQKKVSPLVKNAWNGNLLKDQLNIYNSLERKQNIKKDNNYSIESLARLACENGDNEDFNIFDHLPSTKNFQKEEDIYIQGYQPSPTYAKPIPKSMRLKGNQENKSQNLNGACYSNYSMLRIPREQGDGEAMEEYGEQTCLNSGYYSVSTLKKVPPPILPKPLKIREQGESMQHEDKLSTLDIIPSNSNVNVDIEKGGCPSTIV